MSAPAPDVHQSVQLDRTPRHPPSPAGGGFGGSPMQIAHLAPSYASVCALVSLGGEEALRAVDRQAMYEFLCRMAISPAQGGGFCIHKGDARRCGGTGP